MGAFFKLISIASVLVAVAAGVYLYVSHVDKTTQPSDSQGTSYPINSAADAVDKFDQQTQKSLQNAESQLNQ